MGQRTVRKNGIEFIVNSDTYGDFWDKLENNNWETSTFDAIDRFIQPDGVFLDIGTWIGPMALYAAAKGQKTICIEADPVAAAELRRNVELNPSLQPLITIIERAIYPTPGKVAFGSEKDAGDSESSTVHAHFKTAWEVDTITPEEVAELVPNDVPLFIKMDIEGGEYDVFPRLLELLKSKKPTILLALHCGLLPYNYAKKRKLTRRIFKACKGLQASRLRDKKRFANNLRAFFTRRGLTIPCPRGSWLFYQKS